MSSRVTAIIVGWLLALSFPLVAGAQCRPGLVREFGPHQAIPVAYRLAAKAASPVSIEWFGHAFFRLISPGGTRIVTDPFSFHRGYPIPETSPHAVTIGKESPNHQNVALIGGNPIILRGLKDDGLEWAQIDRKVGDIRVRSIPIAQGGGGDYDLGLGKGASFLFEMGGLCVAHLGDLAEPMNPSQLRRLGRVQVALVVLSTQVSMGPEEAAAFIQKLGPNIAIPMHFYDDEETLAIFLKGFRRVRRLDTNRLSVSRRSLPPPTEIVILRHP